MDPNLQSLSNALAATVAAAGASVIRVDARRRMPASGIAWSADGLVVTAHHVVERDSDIRVGLADGRELPADLVGRDPTTDLAVLRVAASDLAPLDWTDPDDLGVGQLALALGRPGRTVQATLGIVGALGGAWRTAAGGKVDRYLHTDVVMYPGFSGGPLVGADGRAIGLGSSALVRGASVVLPAPTVRRVVGEIVAHGHVRRGYLGVSAQAVRLPTAVAEHLGQESGLLLVGVEPEGPAAQAGLHMGDTLVRLDDQPLRHMDDLAAVLSGDRIGAELGLRYLRGAEVLVGHVRIGERS